MQEIMWENQYRTTIVCVDSYENGILAGRMYNPYLSGGETFRSTMEFLKKAEALLDEMKFPQRFSTNRVFGPPLEVRPEGLPPSAVKEGNLATFSLRILFRQNASWQGSVAWVEGKREESFRSVLELLLLMDSAMCSETTEN